MKVQCKECKCIITERAEDIDKSQEFIMCPYCNKIAENPMYKNEN